MRSTVKSENQYLRDILQTMVPSVSDTPIFEVVVERLSSQQSYTMFRSLAVTSVGANDFEIDTGLGPVTIPGDIGFSVDTTVGLLEEITITPGTGQEVLVTVIRPVSE